MFWDKDVLKGEDEPLEQFSVCMSGRGEGEGRGEEDGVVIVAPRAAPPVPDGSPRTKRGLSLLLFSTSVTTPSTRCGFPLGLHLWSLSQSKKRSRESCTQSRMSFSVHQAFFFPFFSHKNVFENSLLPFFIKLLM